MIMMLMLMRNVAFSASLYSTGSFQRIPIRGAVYLCSEDMWICSRETFWFVIVQDFCGKTESITLNWNDMGSSVQYMFVVMICARILICHCTKTQIVLEEWIMLNNVNSNTYCETHTICLFGNMLHLPRGGLLYFPLAGRKPRRKREWENQVYAQKQCHSLCVRQRCNIWI